MDQTSPLAPDQSPALHRVAYRSARTDGLTDARIVDDIVLPAMRRNRSLGPSRWWKASDRR